MIADDFPKLKKSALIGKLFQAFLEIPNKYHINTFESDLLEFQLIFFFYFFLPSLKKNEIIED